MSAVGVFLCPCCRLLRVGSHFYKYVRIAIYNIVGEQDTRRIEEARKATIRNKIGYVGDSTFSSNKRKKILKFGIDRIHIMKEYQK